MNPGNHGHGEFTPNDRRELIETGVNLKNLREDVLELKKLLSDGDTRFTALLNTQDIRFTELLSKQDKHFEVLLTKMEARIEKHGERIQSLENSKWWLYGAAAGAGAIGSFIARFFHF